MKKQSLRIGIDAFALTMSKAGIANYIYYLLEELLPLLPECHFFLYTPKYTEDLKAFTQLAQVTLCTVSSKTRSHFLWVQTTLTKYLLQNPVEIFWAPTQIFPLLKRKKTKVLLTLYDFVYLLYPETMPIKKRIVYRSLIPHFLRRANAILPISYGTADRLKNYYGIDHYAVVEPPIKPWLSRMDSGRTQSWLKHNHLRYKEYLLTIGTIEPRKNLEKVLHVYAELFEIHPPSAILPLVVMGAFGWKAERVKKLLKELTARYPKHVLVLGYASDEEQWHYLAGARYLLMMSYYEGYGMPIAEARACGTEVICTDTPEMREAAQQQGIFIAQEEIRQKLPHFFVNKPYSYFDKQQEYPSNREKAARIASAIDSLR